MTVSFGEIVALAKDRTPAGRRRLAGQFSDAFFANSGRFNTSERALALDILTGLLRDAALEVRQALAERLAHETQVPHQLIRALANDVIEVAQPVLTSSPVLHEADLMAVAQNKSEAYRIAIANRTQLSPALTDALVSRGEREVALTLLGNIALHIPESTLRLLAAQALEHGDIGTRIASRSELTTEIAEKIYWTIGEELRAQLGKRFPLDNSRINRALEEAVVNLAQRQSDPLRRRSVAERLIATGGVTPPLLIELLKNRGIDLFRELFAGLTKLKPSLVDVLCRNESSEPLALICRALGFSKTEAASFLMLAHDRVGQQKQFNPTHLSGALNVFGELTAGDAKTVLWQWQSDPSYLYALVQRNG